MKLMTMLMLLLGFVVSGQSNAVGFGATSSELPMQVVPDNVGQYYNQGKILLGYIVSGQSNAVGFGATSSELPTAMQIVPDNVELYDNKGRITKYTQREHFGPEVMVAQSLSARFPNAQILIVKYALGASSMSQWSPESFGYPSPSDGQAYPILINTIYNAVKGRRVNWKAFIWVHGEREAKMPVIQGADLYQMRFEAFVTRLTEYLMAPDIQVVMPKLACPLIRCPEVVDMINVQSQLKQDLGVTIVPTFGIFQYPEDNNRLHYNSTQELELGQRISKLLK